MPACWHAERDGVRLAVRLQPGAKAERIDGPVTDADGGRTLKVRVTAPPADGKANEALVALLAKTLKLPKSAVTIRSGHGTKAKILHLAGTPGDVAARLERIVPADGTP